MPLPATLPLFPLPNVVLFPQVLLPLFIFEPRYRQMVKDVAAADELIGMLLLRRPESGAGDDVYSVGCAGRMIRRVEQPDGRSNILLQGVREFVVREQSFDRPYRTANVEWLPPAPRDFRLAAGARDQLVEAIRRFSADAPESNLRILSEPTLNDETLINLFAFALDLPVAEKQGLLEIRVLEERAQGLIDTLEFHALEREFSPGVERLKLRVQ